jgi:Zn-finger protein
MPNLSCPKDRNHKVFVVKDNNKYVLIDENGDGIDTETSFIPCDKGNYICAECGCIAITNFEICPICEDIMENKEQNGTEIWVCRQCEMVLFGYNDTGDIISLKQALGEDVG